MRSHSWVRSHSSDARDPDAAGGEFNFPTNRLSRMPLSRLSVLCRDIGDTGEETSVTLGAYVATVALGPALECGTGLEPVKAGALRVS